MDVVFLCFEDKNSSFKQEGYVMIDDHLGDNPSLFVFSARSRLRDLVREISLAVKPCDLVKVYKAVKMVILGFLAEERGQL